MCLIEQGCALFLFLVSVLLLGGGFWAVLTLNKCLAPNTCHSNYWLVNAARSFGTLEFLILDSVAQPCKASIPAEHTNRPTKIGDCRRRARYRTHRCTVRAGKSSFMTLVGPFHLAEMPWSVACKNNLIGLIGGLAGGCPGSQPFPVSFLDGPPLSLVTGRSHTYKVDPRTQAGKWRLSVQYRADGVNYFLVPTQYNLLRLTSPPGYAV
jgi:hypothetical protein